MDEEQTPPRPDADEPHRVAVLGGTGFIGTYLVLDLLQMGHTVHLLYNRTEPDFVSVRGQIKTFRGSIEDESALRAGFAGCDIVYHLVGIIVETRDKSFESTVARGTANVVAAARAAGVKKIIYLSALGAREHADTQYFRTKWTAEQQVIAAGLDYTIFRPSIVYGIEDKFINMLAGLIRRTPVVPVIGHGRYKLQPVYVEELCAVMAAASRAPFTTRKVYEIGGPEQLTYLEIIDIIKRVMNRRRGTIHVPVWLAKLGAAMMGKILKPAPLTTDQIRMLEAGSTCDQTVAEKEFGVRFSPLERQLRKYLGKQP
jgi:uncharacterized protein YbjT (DUF2867 family)